jgi:AraC-like DNA-binding protein
MILYVRYMVSLRCKMVVKEALKQMGLHWVVVDLGMVEILENLNKAQLERLKRELLVFGLEVLDDKRAILIEKIKGVITDLIHHKEELPRENYSDYLSQQLGYDYTYLANTFSQVKGITIQHYIIMHKIEKVKELILYDELNLTEIAHRMHYSSVAHLSAQFKKVTGLTPSFYKKLHEHRKCNLENL